MKRLVNLLIVAAAMLTGLSGCLKSNNSSNNNTNSTTITNFLKSATNATRFSNALSRANLDTVFNGTGPFTVFVPVDAVFTSSGITDAMLNSYSPTQLRNIILYHTIAAAVISTGFPSGPNAKVIAANGDTLFITSSSGGIFVNGAPLTQTDIFNSNGVVHGIAQVLIPPAGNTWQTLQADTTFTFLTAAITKASEGGSTRIDSLLANGLYTIFAPSNSAFKAAGYASIDDINNADADSLSNTILYHMLAGRVFTSDINNGQSKTTLTGGSITFSLSSSSSGTTKQVKGNGNTTTSTIIKANLVADNGVLYVIDQVLKP